MDRRDGPVSVCLVKSYMSAASTEQFRIKSKARAENVARLRYYDTGT